MTQAIALDHVTKRYGATIALSDASFAVEDGHIHALLGENGAGKSTLVKILSGIIQPDGGEISLFGQPVRLYSREASSRLGLETAFQEIPLVPDLTVSENLLLPHQPRRFGVFLDSGEAKRRVAQILSDLDLTLVDPEDDVRDLDLSVRQKIEIARAISRKPKILILDEPTASLSSRDVEWLGRRIAALRESGTTIILVTHRMQEVREFCQSLSVLRNGAHVGSFAAADVSDSEVFRLIMGRSVETAYPPRPDRTSQAPPSMPLLRASHLSTGRRLVDVSLSLGSGEIVGVAGLQGMGQLELFNALFGVDRLEQGEIWTAGRRLHLASPRDAIRAGIGLVPEDRKIQGLALAMTGRENASLGVLDELSTFGIVDSAREHALVDVVFQKVQVPSRAHYKSARSFSGGNQQKIVLAKWLLSQCKVLLVFDPTRGVDVGTKHEMYGLLRAFADAGGAVLFHSTETPELVGLCDRVLVVYRGRVATELAGDGIREDLIGMHMLGGPASSNHPTRERMAS